MTNLNVTGAEHPRLSGLQFQDQLQTTVYSDARQAKLPADNHFRNWPILLQKDFGCPRKQHSFNMSPRYARLIQRFVRRDSIVATKPPLADF
jgi:hypothetical protein